MTSFGNLSSAANNNNNSSATSIIASKLNQDKVLKAREGAVTSNVAKIIPNVRGPYRRYTPLQAQELFELVIELGMSARKAGAIIGIKERTAQHYVKLYKDDDKQRLPGYKKQSR